VIKAAGDTVTSTSTNNNQRDDDMEVGRLINVDDNKKDDKVLGGNDENDHKNESEKEDFVVNKNDEKVVEETQNVGDMIKMKVADN
jgi:hypothetical protein